ncbi:Coenzyme Q-binding protein COQ10 B, mitochondrial [Allomyces arbusculus]|nr:Coenzyme Q-binding protein COQ10 B, mitochondrial [Allomyces arbusculus]
MFGPSASGLRVSGSSKAAVSLRAAALTRPLRASGALLAVTSRPFFASAAAVLTKPKPVEYSERKLLKFSPTQLCDVVANVNEYAQFVPYCTRATMHTPYQPLPTGLPAPLIAKLRAVPKPLPGVTVALRVPSSADFTAMSATLGVGFGQLSESYTSRVTRLTPHLVVAEAQPSALFTDLLHVWSFAQGPVPNSTWVDIYLKFTFRSGLHAGVAAVFFDQVNRQTIQAFEERARIVYAAPRTVASAGVATAAKAAAVTAAAAAKAKVAAAPTRAGVAAAARAVTATSK